MRYVCKCNNGNPPKKPYNIGMYVCMYKVDTVGQIIWNKHINFKLQPT